MAVIWAVEALPFMHYDGANSTELIAWLEGLGPRYWPGGGDNPTVTVTSEAAGVLELHFLSGDGAMSGTEFDLTAVSGDWFGGNGSVVAGDRFTESFVVK